MELDFVDTRARRVLADGMQREYASHFAAVSDLDASLRCVIVVDRPVHTTTDADSV